LDSKIKITFANTSNAAVLGVLYPSATSTGVGNANEAMMLPSPNTKVQPLWEALLLLALSLIQAR